MAQFTQTITAMFEQFNASVHRLLMAISRPIWLEPGAARLKVNVETGSLSTVSTVTSVTQIAGFDAKQTMLNSLERNLWANAVRRCIT